MRNNWIAIGAFSGALCVVLGALGAHLLRKHIDPDDLPLWDTAVQWQAMHAAALVLYGLFEVAERREGRPSGATAGWLFLLGTLCFCGPLYAHPLGAPGWVVHVTPVGGLLLILGWIVFGARALRSQDR